MRYQLLGPSGRRVSELCLGTMSVGEAWGFGADEKQSRRILGVFAEAGGTFLDTANLYHQAQSEEILGRFLGPDRDRFVVATKYTLAMRSGDPNAAKNARKNLRASVEASLRRLRTDYLDLLWVHYSSPVEEVLGGLDDLVAAGKINHVALSDAPLWGAAAATSLTGLWGWSPLVALQGEYSLIERAAERQLLPVADLFDLSVCAWAPTGAGILTGKFTRGPCTLSADSRPAANQARLTERNLRIAREVDHIADQLGVTSAQVAVAWVRQRGRRIIPILGVRILDQLYDALGSLEVELSAEHRTRLDQVSRIEFRFPDELLRGPWASWGHGDLEPQMELPVTAL